MGLEKAQVAPNEAIVVENAPIGVQAGVAAGIFTIAVNTGPLDEQVLLNAGANLLFPSMLAFNDSWEKVYQTLQQVSHIIKKEGISSTDIPSHFLLCNSYLAASKDALRKAFIAFSISNEALRARVPAALFPFSTCAFASFQTLHIIQQSFLLILS